MTDSILQLKAERSLIWKHTLTVLTGQLAAVLSGVVDTVVAGQFSSEALAALSVASALNISVIVSLIGVLNVLLPIYAEHRGAGRKAEVGRTLHQGLYLAAGLSVIALLILMFPRWLLTLAKVPPDLIPDIERYLAVQAFVVPLFMLFRMYAALNQALGKPWFVTWLQIAILVLKIPLSFYFVSLFGLVGCAMASLLVTSFALTLGLYLIATHSDYKPYKVWRRMDPPNTDAIIRHLKLGLPAGLSQLVEITSFTLISLLVARLGIIAAGAHQIASSVAAMVFMLPISYGVAATSRVSYWIGHGNPKLAAALVKQTLMWGLIFGTLLCLLVLAVREWLAMQFSTNPDVVHLACTLLIFVALYHIPDGLQIMGMFLLRCYKITLMPLIVYSIFLWGIGLGGGYYLAYGGVDTPFAQNPSAFWLTAIVSLSIVAAWFSIALLQVSKRKANLSCQTKVSA
jgi:multidrug resistance protein, MATE family